MNDKTMGNSQVFTIISTITWRTRVVAITNISTCPKAMGSHGVSTTVRISQWVHIMFLLCNISSVIGLRRISFRIIDRILTSNSSTICRTQDLKCCSSSDSNLARRDQGSRSLLIPKDCNLSQIFKTYRFIIRIRTCISTTIKKTTEQEDKWPRLRKSRTKNLRAKNLSTYPSSNLIKSQRLNP